MVSSARVRSLRGSVTPASSASVVHQKSGTSMRSMVLKNLIANRDRNKMTAIIYSLGLGFIIFLNMAQRTQIQIMGLHMMKFHVSYLE